MSFFADWLAIFSIGLVVVIAPGPDFAITVRNSLVYSRRAGVLTAVGIFVGNVVHASYCLVGIGAVIAQSILLFNILKWLGAIYLIYIGIKSLQAKRQPIDDVDRPTQQRDISRWMAFRIGFLANLLNPKATLFSLALFTQLIRPGTPTSIQVLYGLTVPVLALIWFALVASLISQRSVKAMLRSISHWIERATGAMLILLGLRLAIAKAHE
jgi:RhtB (resistance to homoserine/threonine) family protein